MAATILERFWKTRTTTKQQQQAEALSAYQDLVGTLAAGKNAPDQATVDAVLAAVHKSDAELRADVDAELTAIADKRLVRTKADTLKRMQTVNQAAEEATAEMHRVRREALATHTKRQAELSRERSALLHELDAIAKAEARTADRDGTRQKQLTEMITELQRRQREIATDKPRLARHGAELATIMARIRRYREELKGTTPAVA